MNCRISRVVSGVRIGLIAALTPLWAVLAVGQMPIAHADEVNLVPALTVKEEYSDNMFFSSSDPRSGFLTAISPAFEYFRKSETASGSARARLDTIFYRGDRDKATVLNHSYAANYRLRPSPLFDFGIDASYRINNRPDQSLERRDLVLNSVRRDRQSYSIDAGYELTELMSGKVSYQFGKEAFDSPALLDYVSHSGALRITRDMESWLPSLKGVVEGGYARYEFQSSTTDNYSLSLGCIWAFTETVSMTAMAGGRYTRSEFESTQLSPVAPFTLTKVAGSSSNNGWVAQLELTKSGEVASGALTLNRTVSISSGRNGASETTSLDGNFRYMLSPELTATMSAGYEWDTSDAGQYVAGRLDQESIRFDTGVSYELFRELTVDAKYSFNRVIYREIAANAVRNTVFLGLTYHYPVFGR